MEIRSQSQDYLIFQNFVNHKLLIWVQTSRVHTHFAKMCPPKRITKFRQNKLYCQDLDTARTSGAQRKGYFLYVRERRDTHEGNKDRHTYITDLLTIHVGLAKCNLEQYRIKKLNQQTEYWI